MGLVAVSIWTLNISLFFSVFLGSMGKGLSMGKQSIRKTCRCPVYAPSAVTKYLNFLVWSGDGDPWSQRSFFENCWSSVIVFHRKGDKCASRVPWRMPARRPLCWMVMHRGKWFSKSASEKLHFVPNNTIYTLLCSKILHQLVPGHSLFECQIQRHEDAVLWQIWASKNEGRWCEMYMM